VLVKKDKPLPEAVEKADAEKLSAIDMPKGGSEPELSETMNNLDGAVSASGFATGKRTCVAMQAEYTILDLTGPLTKLQCVAPGCPVEDYTFPMGTSKSSVVAEAKARIAAQPDTDKWVLIVEDCSTSPDRRRPRPWPGSASDRSASGERSVASLDSLLQPQDLTCDGRQVAIPCPVEPVGAAV